MSVCLWGGPEAAASHRTAAAIWGLIDDSAELIEFSSPRRMSIRPAKLVAHRRILIHQIDLTRRRGLPVTQPERTLLDLAAVVSIRTLESALEEALRRRATTLPRLRQRLIALGRSGRDGTASFRRLLDDRTDAYIPTDSDLEIDFDALVKKYRLPTPKRQKHVTTRLGRRLRCDFVYEAEKIAIECDGYDFHGLSREGFEKDRAVGNALVLDGWLLLRYTYRDIHEYPDRVAEEISEALRQRGHAEVRAV